MEGFSSAWVGCCCWVVEGGLSSEVGVEGGRRSVVAVVEGGWGSWVLWMRLQ
jgi:hypothetical protein